MLPSPMPRGSCPVLAAAAQDPNLSNSPVAKPHPQHGHELWGMELPLQPWRQARAAAALRLWGLPPQDSPGEATPGARRTCLCEEQQGQAAVSAPPAGRAGHGTSQHLDVPKRSWSLFALKKPKKNPKHQTTNLQRLKAGPCFADSLSPRSRER